MLTEKLNILLFCNKPPKASNANTVIDHIDAFTQYSQHNIVVYSHPGFFPDNLNLDLFDVIVIHYSAYLLNDYYITPNAKNRIARFKGMKILFLQDEYRKVNQFHAMIQYLGIDILYTCIPENEINKIYPEEKLPGLVKINNLTGYMPSHLLEYASPPIAKRKIDVGYRSRKLPFWYGTLCLEKWKIVDDFIDHTKNDNLICDLSYDENKRIYGDKWVSFVQSCKTMLGVESGASVIDFTGELEASVEKYQATHPTASFDEVYKKFLMEYDGKIYMNQISPRCFEAIALKTPLVLFEGRYSDILVADRHYISLKKDFSNIQEVVSKIKNDNYLQNLANTAYEEIGLNEKYTYRNFIRNFDAALTDCFMQKGLSPQRNHIPASFIKDTFKYMPLKTQLKVNFIKLAYSINCKIPIVSNF
jgi:hypothetical protein